MKNYRNIQKNHFAVICIFYLILTIVLLNIFFLEFYSLVGIIISCSILGIVLVVLFFLIKTNRISRIKISDEGMLVKINRELKLFPWSELIEIKIKKIINARGGPFIKFTFCSKEKSFDIYSQDYFFEFLIEYCTSVEFASKLKETKLKILENCF